MKARAALEYLESVVEFAADGRTLDPEVPDALATLDRCVEASWYLVNTLDKCGIGVPSGVVGNAAILLRAALEGRGKA